MDLRQSLNTISVEKKQRTISYAGSFPAFPMEYCCSVSRHSFTPTNVLTHIHIKPQFVSQSGRGQCQQQPAGFQNLTRDEPELHCGLPAVVYCSDSGQQRATKKSSQGKLRVSRSESR